MNASQLLIVRRRHAGNFTQIPNSLIFQRVIRRWKGGMPVVTESTPATKDEEACAMEIATPSKPA